MIERGDLYRRRISADAVAWMLGVDQGGTMPQGKGSDAVNTVSPLMTADELAMWLHCSRRAVYDRVYRGQLPGPVRVGRRLYFVRESVLAWLRENSEPRAWRES